MPRRPPHFKAFTTIKNHEKLRQVYANNDLLATARGEGGLR